MKYKIEVPNYLIEVGDFRIKHNMYLLVLFTWLTISLPDMDTFL